jgi:hypothetical protein
MHRALEFALALSSYYGGVKVVRSFYGAGVEAFMGLGELYIRSADEFASRIVGVDISTEGWPVFRWSTMSGQWLGSRYVILSAWKVLR